MKSSPKISELLLALTDDCNLACPHCSDPKSGATLAEEPAVRFLSRCKKASIKRVSFTGGEPFLKSGLLCELTSSAVKDGYLFGRIMTNGVWFRDEAHLESVLSNLFAARYDGDICISIDALHRQKISKLADFIRTALEIWRRPDIVSIACVRQYKDEESRKKLEGLARRLRSRLAAFNSRSGHIRGRGILIRIHNIDLSPIDKAAALKEPWDGRWFKDDFCAGPGGVFFVTPCGDVKPCCGYASDLDMFTIGNIKKDTPEEMLKYFRKNRYLYAIFNLGLGFIRKRLERYGVVFPGKTTSHCYFCNYIFNSIPNYVLDRCLN